MRSNATEPINEPDLRPKALRYRDKLQAVEDMMVDALPDIVGKLISMAKDGDIAASRFIVDRNYGRDPRLPHAPAVDQTQPCDHSEWAVDLLQQMDRRDRRRAHYMPQSTASQPDNTSSFPGIGTPDDYPSLDAIR